MEGDHALCVEDHSECGSMLREEELQGSLEDAVGCLEDATDTLEALCETMFPGQTSRHVEAYRKVISNARKLII